MFLEYALYSAGITLFLNYIIGKPGMGFSPYEIFSSYTVWLSVRRLKRLGLYDTYIKQYNENISKLKIKHEIITINNDFKIMLYNAADPFFTWERAFGMCVICTGFWISLLFGLVVIKDFYGIFENIVISYIVLKFLTKYL